MNNLPPNNNIDLLESVKTIARAAGKAILAIYRQDNFIQHTKSDDTPVTAADFASNDILIRELLRLTPDIPVISEEVQPTAFDQRSKWQRYWLLDPLDGTQEFISRSGDFAVNIALVENDWPVLGVIYWPTRDIFYYAVKGHGAYKQQGKDSQDSQRIHATKGQEDVLRVAISRVQKLETVSQFLLGNVEVDFKKYGSCALKSCFVAEGIADCYLRIGPTGEWDTGAPHIIVEEAGGKILDSEFKSLSYNQRHSLKNPDFLVLGDQTIDWQHIIKPHPTTRDY